ncbi:MAG: CvpA family protein [Chloroflexi bacterium]|nr:CvpA family protein [Chloroflexota bacterium]
MNWLDIVILVIVGVAAFAGLKSGLIKIALSLAGVILGVILAGRFYFPLAERLTFIQQDNIAQVVAFAVILVGVMLIASVLAAILKGIASLLMLDWLNHLGGAVLGFILGALFCAALLTLWVKFPDAPEPISSSSLSGVLLDRFPAVLALLPEEFDAIRSFFQ